MAEASESLITGELRAQIGKIGRPMSGEVTRKEISRFCAAVGDDNPLFRDPEAARAAGYADVIAPPLFYPYALDRAVRLDQLRPDGIARSAGGSETGPKWPLPRIMAGGVEVEYREPIYPGDVLTATSQIADIRERHGRSGPLILQVVETTYRNQRDEIVLIERTTTINR